MVVRRPCIEHLTSERYLGSRRTIDLVVNAELVNVGTK